MPEGQFEEAVRHYKTVLDTKEATRTDDSVELKGPNFTIYVEKSTGPVSVLHEWVTCDGEAARQAHLAAGSTITGESHSGFYVRDPYGMSYHVFVEEEPEA